LLADCSSQIAKIGLFVRVWPITNRDTNLNTGLYTSPYSMILSAVEPS
jgi:hypothetical protein